MMEEIVLQPGMERTVQKRVAYEDTTVSFGRAGIETLLSTPALVGMMIEACVDLIGDNVPEGFISVARNLELSHEKPTLQGMMVTVQATIEQIDNNVVLFDLICFDEIGEVARGRMERHIVNKDALINRAQKRAETLEGIQQ